MRVLSVAEIKVDVARYTYRLKNSEEGLVRDINHESRNDETISFTFDVKGLSQIVLRNASTILNTGDQKIYFNYKDRGSLSSVHFENDEYIWVVLDVKAFMDDCLEAYLDLVVLNRIQTLTENDRKRVRDTLDKKEIIDEFDEEEDD